MEKQSKVFLTKLLQKSDYRAIIANNISLRGVVLIC